ncbi:MAG: class I SAM-dependent rRNA methyltransferase, partial [Rhodospirillales bacterium]
KALPPGNLVRLLRVDGKPIGIGTFNPHSLIAFRVLDREHQGPVDWTPEALSRLVEDRLRRAATWRDRLIGAPHYRLVHGEADGLPGLIVDRYGDVFTVQSGTAGMDGLLPLVLDVLESRFSARAVVIRNDQAARRLEGLEEMAGLARGQLDGPVALQENGLTFLADPLSGQKTGWFFDQRDNHAFAARLVPAGGRVLDAYCYGGGFGLTALGLGDAGTVRFIDQSQTALDLVGASAEALGQAGKITLQRGDAFKCLEDLGADQEAFDLVVCDPPAFAKAKKDVGPALKAYRKLARMAAKLVKPGGNLVLASCSHHVGPAEFLREAAIGFNRAGRSAQLIKMAGAAPDHPVLPDLPESAYLKCLFFRLD